MVVGNSKPSAQRQQQAPAAIGELHGNALLAALQFRACSTCSQTRSAANGHAETEAVQAFRASSPGEQQPAKVPPAPAPRSMPPLAPLPDRSKGMVSTSKQAAEPTEVDRILAMNSSISKARPCMRLHAVADMAAKLVPARGDCSKQAGD